MKENNTHFLELLKVLGNNTRFDIILLLASGEKCVCEIYKKLNLPQNLVSHHLGILRQNKLIIDRKDGNWVYHSLNRKNIKVLKDLLEQIISKKEIISKC
jgi:ArsR family transcriptional regulator